MAAPLTVKVDPKVVAPVAVREPLSVNPPTVIELPVEDPLPVTELRVEVFARVRVPEEVAIDRSVPADRLAAPVMPLIVAEGGRLTEMVGEVAFPVIVTLLPAVRELIRLLAVMLPFILTSVFSSR